MAMTQVLDEADITRALEAVAAPNSFNCKTFFEMVGMKKLKRTQQGKAFSILDDNESGFLEPNELKTFLGKFNSNGRDLTEKEVRDFLEAGDLDGDGKINFDEFRGLLIN